MASMATQTLFVEKVGKFGFQTGGIWYGLSKKSGLTPASFVAGSNVTVKVFTTDDGKKYVTQLVGNAAAPAPVAPVVPAPTPVVATPVVSTPVVTRSVDSKDRRIGAHGVIQAAIQAPVLQMFATSYEEWWALVEKTSINALEFVKRHSD